MKSLWKIKVYLFKNNSCIIFNSWILKFATKSFWSQLTNSISTAKYIQKAFSVRKKILIPFFSRNLFNPIKNVHDLFLNYVIPIYRKKYLFKRWQFWQKIFKPSIRTTLMDYGSLHVVTASIQWIKWNIILTKSLVTQVLRHFVQGSAIVPLF